MDEYGVGSNIQFTVQSGPDLCPALSPGFNFSAESVAQLEGRVNMYHHLVETLKFAGGQRWRQWDPRSHPEVQVKLPGAGGIPLSFPRSWHTERVRADSGRTEEGG